MEVEKMHFDFEPSYISDHACYFQNNPPIPAYNSIQDFIPDDFNPENFLEMETDAMDFSFIDKDCTLKGQNEGEKRLQSVAADEQSRLKDIQDELMEESSLTDLLVMGVEAVESGNLPFASIVAMRLKDILSDQEENGDNPIDRLALYFTQGLLNRSLNGPPDLPWSNPVLQETNIIPVAFLMLQELSPYAKFAHFKANQAILEATEGQKKVHVIDFDIMEGIQWPSLMVDLAAAKEDVSLRITAIVADKRSLTRTQQTGCRLLEFADSIHLSFSFDQILIKKEEDFGKIQVGDTLVANCMINQLYMPNKGSTLVNTFLNGLRKLSPRIIVLVQEELFKFKAPNTSFVEFFCEAMNHYTALSDSLQSGFCGGSEFAYRVIEKEFLRTRILDTLKIFRSGTETCPYLYPSMAWFGFKAIPMSSCNVTQAKHLVSLFNGGYWVQNKRCGLTLCWKSRPLTTASIWAPAVSVSRHNSLVHRSACF